MQEVLTMSTVQSLATCNTLDTLTACRAAVAELETHAVIAVDSEGVHLSRTGPLTVLQIAIPNSPGAPKAKVFIFDVLREPRMFSDGGLKSLLENDRIVKVLHSAKNDAQALWWQKKVDIRNVHDTQVAHQELEKSRGHTFPPRAKLSEVCSIYCPQKTSLVDLDKDVVVAKMNRTDGEYWAKRPLTEEMINYAASDVIALVPEVYNNQKKLLEEKGLMQTFKSRVERELRATKDTDVQKALQREELDMVAATLRNFVKASPRTTRFQDITDNSVMDALRIVRLNEVTELALPAVVRELKLEEIKARMDEVEMEIQQKGRDYDAHGACRQFSAFVHILEGTPHKEQAKRLSAQLNKMVLEDVKTKYGPSTNLVYVAPYEKKIITRELKPRGESDPTVPPRLLSLYWRIRTEELEEEMQKLKDNPLTYDAKHYVKLLKFYVSGNVPAALKRQGKEFLETLQQMGKVARPPSSRRGGSYRHGLSDDYFYDDFNFY